MKTIITQLHNFSYNLNKPDERVAFEKLETDARAAGIKIFEAHGNYYNLAPTGPVQLQTDFLFSNQWNTTCGKRLFDFSLEVVSENIKRGHYLEQMPEMKDIREKTLVCGYCGAFESAPKPFCLKCLNNKYLKINDLHLLRLLPVALHNPKREPLNQEEKNYLTPLYRAAQNKRLLDLKPRLIEENNNKIIELNKELEVKLWCLDRGIEIDNLIYYKHKNIFTFGFNEPVTKQFELFILDYLAEFPYQYEIRCEDGRVLKNEA